MNERHDMAEIGTITATLHLSIGDGTPSVIAHIGVPLIADPPVGFEADVSLRIDKSAFTANLAGALRAAADVLEATTTTPPIPDAAEQELLNDSFTEA